VMTGTVNSAQYATHGRPLRLAWKILRQARPRTSDLITPVTGTKLNRRLAQMSRMLHRPVLTIPVLMLSMVSMRLMRMLFACKKQSRSVHKRNLKIKYSTEACCTISLMRRRRQLRRVRMPVVRHMRTVMCPVFCQLTMQVCIDTARAQCTTPVQVSAMTKLSSMARVPLTRMSPDPLVGRSDNRHAWWRLHQFLIMRKGSAVGVCKALLRA
jgi:hypothetical protein